jgi:hypothetical protein
LEASRGRGAAVGAVGPSYDRLATGPPATSGSIDAAIRHRSDAMPHPRHRGACLSGVLAPKRLATLLLVPLFAASLSAAPPLDEPLDPDPGCGAPPAGSAGAPRPPEPPPLPVAPAFDAEGLLDRLEAAGQAMREYAAGLTLIRFDSLLEESETRLGEVVLSRGEDGSSRIAVLFEEIIDGSGHGERWRQHWIYADGWLVEMDHRQKRCVKRQLVGPGESFDPLKIGEGPIPLPIAQSRREVLARFTAMEAPPPSPPLLDRLAGFVSIRLVPRPETDLAEDFAWVDLFYDQESLAPLAVRTLKRNGDRDTVWLRRPQLNRGFGEAQQALLAIEPLDPAEWQLDVRPLRPAGP